MREYFHAQALEDIKNNNGDRVNKGGFCVVSRSFPGSDEFWDIGHPNHACLIHGVWHEALRIGAKLTEERHD